MVVRLGVVLGASLLALVTACGSSALTNGSRDDAGNNPTTAPTRPAYSNAMAGAVFKLELISQDGCQTKPADQVYPNCDRFMAELRSAVGTVRNGSSGLPNGPKIAETSQAVLADVGAFDRDGCGTSRPGAAGPTDPALCVADLERIRAGVRTLREQTKGIAGG